MQGQLGGGRPSAMLALKVDRTDSASAERGKHLPIISEQPSPAAKATSNLICQAPEPLFKTTREGH